MVGLSRIRHWLSQLLHTHDTPHRTAAAYAMGVFFGFSPFLGLHTVIALALAFLLGLNRVAVVLGVYSNLPWIVPAYYTLATIAGAALLGVRIPPGVLEEAIDSVSAVSWGEFRDLFRTLSPLLRAFTLGSTLGAAVLAAIAYRVSLTMIVAHRRRISHGSSEPSYF